MKEKQKAFIIASAFSLLSSGMLSYIMANSLKLNQKEEKILELEIVPPLDKQNISEKHQQQVERENQKIYKEKQTYKPKDINQKPIPEQTPDEKQIIAENRQEEQPEHTQAKEVKNEVIRKTFEEKVEKVDKLEEKKQVEEKSTVTKNTSIDEISKYLGIVKQIVEKKKVYPQEAKRRRHQGVVTISISVDENGSIKYVNLVRSSGSFILDQETIRMVRSIKNLPEPPEKKPIEFIIEIEYSLGGE